MIGALAGDIIGSVYEGDGPRSKAFPLFAQESQFTDDSVLTVAVASAIRNGGDYGDAILRWGRRYPHAGYGGMFRRWLQSSRPVPYNSFGNGSAMRVSAVAWAFEDLETVLAEAGKSAECSHNHPEGIKGAQATAGAIFLGRKGGSKDEIRTLISGRFGYDLSASLDDLREHSTFDETCQGTVPAAAIAFLESIDFEDAIRNCVSIGGDVDTLACIAGSIAEGFYGGVPEEIQRQTILRLDGALLDETIAFAQRYGVPLRPAS